jgi:hypothetical protein
MEITQAKPDVPAQPGNPTRFGFSLSNEHILHAMLSELQPGSETSRSPADD